VQALRVYLVFFALSAGLTLLASAPAGATPTAVPAKCSAFGPTWRRTYNKKAAASGNPVRILTACCQPTRRPGVNHCFVMVGLAGTPSKGCESVDIGPNGLPFGVGKHELCQTGR
jgi:hypothetical protein